MPINPSALSSPDPDDAAKERQDASDYVAETQQREEQPQRKRRTKAELIADAVVPAADAQIEVKDSGTGARIKRPWPEAVALVKGGQAEFVDKSLKYAVLKMEQQPIAESSAFAQPAQEERPLEAIDAARDAAAAASSDDPAEREVRYTIDGQALLKTALEQSDAPDDLVVWQAENGESGKMWTKEWDLLAQSPPMLPENQEQPASSPSTTSVPPDAELGDEVRVGSETLRVGHGGVLTTSPVAVNGEVVRPRRRWQRQLGAGSNGPWESTLLRTDETSKAVEPVSQNGHGDGPVVQTERLPHTQEQFGTNVLKLGTGTLDKIGLPDYSSLQIGPITISRTVLDDGRRHTETVKGREVTVITAAVEAFEEMDNTVEFIGARFRGQLQSFLEATGALKQPVS
jgi:hypothetical protein